MPAWRPYQSGDIKVIERVMRRATKIPGRLRDLNYTEQRNRFGLTDRETRRNRGDLIQQFKINKKFEMIKFVKPCELSAPRSEKSAQMKRELVRNCNQRNNFFSNRIVRQGNGSTSTAGGYYTGCHHPSRLVTYRSHLRSEAYSYYYYYYY